MIETLTTRWWSPIRRFRHSRKNLGVHDPVATEQIPAAVRLRTHDRADRLNCRLYFRLGLLLEELRDL